MAPFYLLRPGGLQKRLELSFRPDHRSICHVDCVDKVERRMDALRVFLNDGTKSRQPRGTCACEIDA